MSTDTIIDEILDEEEKKQSPRDINSIIEDKSQKMTTIKVNTTKCLRNYINTTVIDSDQLMKYFKNRGITGKLNLRRISQMQTTDPVLALIISRVFNDNKSPTQELGTKINKEIQKGYYKYKFDSVHQVYKLLYNNNIIEAPEKWRLVIPFKLITPLLTLYHNEYIHLGQTKMEQRITPRYYWINMYAHIKDFVARCNICQATKIGTHQHKAVFTWIKPTSQNQLVAIDFIGPLPETQGKYKNILVIMDIYDGYVKLIPTVSQTSAEWIVSFMNNWLYEEGVPEAILSDNAPTFRSEANHIFSKMIGFNLTFIAPYNAQANGKVERINAEIKKYLRIIGFELGKQVSYKELNWVIFLPTIQFVINIAIKSDTGFSPYFLRKKKLPPDITTLNWNSELQLIKREINNRELYEILDSNQTILNSVQQQTITNISKHIHNNYKKYIKRYISLQRNRITFKVGDYVMVKLVQFKGTKAKLSQRYLGPFMIIQQNSFRNSSLLKPLYAADVQKKLRSYWRNNQLLKKIPKPTNVEFIPKIVIYGRQTDESWNNAIKKAFNNKSRSVTQKNFDELSEPSDIEDEQALADIIFQDKQDRKLDLREQKKYEQVHPPYRYKE